MSPWAKGMDHTDPKYILDQSPKIIDFLHDLIDEFGPGEKFRNEYMSFWFSETKSTASSHGKKHSYTTTLKIVVLPKLKKITLLRGLMKRMKKT